MNGTSVDADTDGSGQVFGLLLPDERTYRMILFFQLTSLRVNMNGISIQ